MQRAKKSQPKGSKAGSPKRKAMPTTSSSATSVGIASSASLRRASSSLVHRLRDKDLIVNVTSTPPAANTAIRISCNPRFWPNSRAFQESLGWQTYTPHSITVHWLPSVPTTTAGQIIGGTLYDSQIVSRTLFANALISTNGSYAGPIWQPCKFVMDLTSLTQPKYLLNSYQEDGVPCSVFISLPSTAVGILSVEYDISFYGHNTIPAQVPLYDVVARSVTTPANLTSADFVLTDTTGLTGGNYYSAVMATSTVAAANPRLSNASGGAGPVVFECGLLNSILPFQGVSDLTSIQFKEGVASLYLKDAAAQSQTMFVWVQGALN